MPRNELWVGLVHIAAVIAGVTLPLMYIHTNAVDNTAGGRMSTKIHKSIDEMEAHRIRGVLCEVATIDV